MQLTVDSVLAMIDTAAAATTGPYFIGVATSAYELGVLNFTIFYDVYPPVSTRRTSIDAVSNCALLIAVPVLYTRRQLPRPW
ncbi:hypothetical protein CF319_g779 [Tilletia indica]|nr:hypothetical protein CF319_g779 [Tilletia indica]